jgi:PAS domain S-box-containing protein
MNHSPCILVVDDNPLVLRASGRILREAGYTVIEASSGAECLRLAREHTPALILLDVAMDEPNGIEICRQLKADPALAHSFVILFSGIKTESNDQARGIETGADGYITRPISNRELVARVQGMLRIRAAEDALRAISARHQAMLTAIPDIIMEVDKNKVYTWANDAGYAFFGKDVIGKPADFYFEGEQDTYTIVQPLFNGKHEDIIYVESWQRRQDGEKRLLAWWCRTLRDAHGNVIGALSTARDITEQKRAQAALQQYSERLEQMVEERTRELRAAQEQLLRQERLTLLGQIAGGIGHELRGPLSAISNAAYLLRQILAAPDAETRETLDILTRQVEASNRIITSLLSFARPQPPVRRPTDVRAVLAAALAQAALPDTIIVQREFDDALPEVQADADQLQIVFVNLIRNAAQAMWERGGTLTISAKQISDFRFQNSDLPLASRPETANHKSEIINPKSVIEICVTDTGIGIPPEIRDKLFQPLFTTKSRGLGLGLALCKLIVEAHGGTIAVESIVGKGATFIVRLPVEQ